MRDKHRIQSDKYSATFPARNITEWTNAIREWEADYTKPDPFAEPEYSEYNMLFYLNSADFYLFAASTSIQVRQMMADEDARDMETGIHFPHKVSASIFVRMGLEIEEHQ